MTKHKLQVTIAGQTATGKTTLALGIQQWAEAAGFVVQVKDVDLDGQPEVASVERQAQRLAALPARTELSIETMQSQRPVQRSVMSQVWDVARRLEDKYRNNVLVSVCDGTIRVLLDSKQVLDRDIEATADIVLRRDEANNYVVLKNRDNPHPKPKPKALDALFAALDKMAEEDSGAGVRPETAADCLAAYLTYRQGVRRPATLVDHPFSEFEAPEVEASFETELETARRDLERMEGQYPSEGWAERIAAQQALVNRLEAGE